MSGLYETTEETMIQAHQAGIAYWTRNKPYNATKEGIASVARSRHWHDGDCEAFVAGFFGAKQRYENEYEIAFARRAPEYNRR